MPDRVTPGLTCSVFQAKTVQKRVVFQAKTGQKRAGFQAKTGQKPDVFQAKTGQKRVQNKAYSVVVRIAQAYSTTGRLGCRGGCGYRSYAVRAIPIGHAAWTPTLQVSSDVFLSTRRSKPSPTYDFDPPKTGKNRPKSMIGYFLGQF